METPLQASAAQALNMQAAAPVLQPGSAGEAADISVQPQLADAATAPTSLQAVAAPAPLVAHAGHDTAVAGVGAAMASSASLQTNANTGALNLLLEAASVMAV